MNGIEQFAVGVVTVCVVIMRGIGVIDDLFSQLMQYFGIYNASWQLGILLILMVFYVALSLRAVGGMLGWAMLFFAVLLVLHRTVPSLTEQNLTVAPALQNAL